MKLSRNFIFRKIAEESLLIPMGKAALEVKGLIALSETGSILAQKLRQGCTKEDLVAALRAEYDISQEVADADVEAFLNQMRQLDMLVED